MKKLFCIALALCLVFALAACGEAESETSPTPNYDGVTPSDLLGPTPEPTPRDEYFVISMFGDCTLSSSQRENTFEYIVDGDMAYPFSGVKQFFEGDYLTIANLECSLSPEPLYGSSTFQFCGDAENAQMLIEGSVEFVTLGNNHTMDFGQKGLDNTTATLDEYGIDYAVPDGSFVYQSEDGPSIGLYAAPWCATEAQVRAGVSALAARGDVDLVVCLMHWGMEGYYRPWGSQTSLGRAAVDSGADIVYGSHPHVLQPIEVISGEQGNDTLVLYSLGNFVSAQDVNSRMLGGMAKWTLVYEPQTKAVSVEDVRFEPTVMFFDAAGKDVQVWPLSQYDDTLAARHLLSQQGEDMSKRYFTDLCREIMGGMMEEEDEDVRAKSDRI